MSAGQGNGNPAGSADNDQVPEGEEDLSWSTVESEPDSDDSYQDAYFEAPLDEDAPFEPRAVEHDGTNSQFLNSDDIVNFSVKNGLTKIGQSAAMKCRRLRSLSGLSASLVSSIGISAFDVCDLRSLAGLPATLAFVASHAFARNHNLPSLAGLPYGARCHKHAFGAPERSDQEETQCALLLELAVRRGHRKAVNPIDAMVRDRRKVPGRRARVLLAVRVAREQEEGRGQEEPVAPLLARIAELPDELVREVIELRYS
jgi:hypothetical protein